VTAPTVEIPVRTNELLAEYLVSMHVALGNDTDEPVDSSTARMGQILDDVEDIWLTARHQMGVAEQIMLALDALESELVLVAKNAAGDLKGARAATNARVSLLQARVILNRMGSNVQAARELLSDATTVAA
jgi:hypothetical protein